VSDDPLRDAEQTAKFEDEALEVRDWARLLGARFKALLSEGFTRPEAMDIVLAQLEEAE
jgi:hypothetical protein